MSNGGVRKLRSSSMDRTIGCPPSEFYPGFKNLPKVRPGDQEEAAVGHCSHACMNDLVETGAYDIGEAASRFGVEENLGELRMLVETGGRIWGELREAFPKPQVEVPVESSQHEYGPDKEICQVTGTIDLLSVLGPAKAAFIDWKSGYLRSRHSQQMASYAYCLWCTMGCPDDAEITAVIAYLRNGTYVVTKWSATDLDTWRYDLIHNTLENPTTFHPGSICTYCPHSVHCDARIGVSRQTIDDVLMPATTGNTSYSEAAERLQNLRPEEVDAVPGLAEVVDDLLHRKKILSQASDKIHTLLLETTERCGRLPAGDGMNLILSPHERRTLDPTKALDILRAHLSDADLAKIMRLPFGATIQGVLKGKVGQKALRETLIAHLEEAGAIKTTEYETLDTVDATAIATGEDDAE